MKKKFLLLSVLCFLLIIAVPTGGQHHPSWQSTTCSDIGGINYVERTIWVKHPDCSFLWCGTAWLTVAEKATIGPNQLEFDDLNIGDDILYKYIYKQDLIIYIRLNPEDTLCMHQ